MTKYEARITHDGTGKFYALCVRVDKDGEETVLRGYEGRYFKTQKAAEKSTSKYLTRIAGE